MIFADAHSCLPLHAQSDINQLKRHFDAGARYISINVGMDLNPLEQIISTIASFRAQLIKSEYIFLAKNYSDLIKARKNNLLAITFDLEGAIPLLELPEMVALYKYLGVRQIHLAYNRNNSISGGAHDIPRGLTKLGEIIVDEIHKQGILMDLSHSDEKSALDICNYSGDRPCIFSHGNPNALFKHERNVSDKALKACAKTNGLVCINGVASFLGDNEMKPTTFANFIDYTVQLLGINFVGIGLDFCYSDGIDDMPQNIDKNYWWPIRSGYSSNGLSGRYFPPEYLGQVFYQLENKGYKKADIRSIAYSNLEYLIKRVWK